MQEMNTILRTFPWNAVTGQVENCEHIPKAILSLGASDPQVRKDAYWKIDNHVVVQGGLYEGAFYVVPFLLEGATSPSKHGRVESLKLLFEIASGAASFDQTVRFRTIYNPHVYYFPDTAGDCIPLCIAVRFAVASGLEKLIGSLFVESVLERECARDLISLFPEFAYAITEKVQQSAIANSNTVIMGEINGLMRELRN